VLPYGLIILSVALAMVVVAIVLAIAARGTPRLRPWVTITALGVVAMPAAIVLHNVLSAIVGGDEGVSFIVALMVAPSCIAVGVIGAAVVLLRERHDLGVAVCVAAAGIGLFAAYMVFALIVTTIEGRNPDYQGLVELALLPLGTLAAIGGALLSVRALMRERTAPA
jgi:hypothetical protein